MLDLLCFLFGLFTPIVFIVLVLWMYPPSVMETIFMVVGYALVAGTFAYFLYRLAKVSSQ